MASFAEFNNILPDPMRTVGYQGNPGGGNPGPGYSSILLKSLEPMMKSTHNSERLYSSSGFHHRWELDIEYNELTCEEFYLVYSFLCYRRSTMQPFYVYVPNYSDSTVPSYTIPAEAAKGSTTILVNNTGVTPNMVFRGTSTKVYKITRVETETDYAVTSPGTGKARIHFVPPLQETFPNGTMIFYANVLFFMQVASEVLEYSINDNSLYSFSVSLEEVRV